ncbi:histidine kinase [Sphaerisporangium sp. NPDC051011]|uniref:sensor histidine kinase n=1 Tax=Sphaerisporangium sp. NPDC051011 TaxID=3155792 RepID=UPI003405A2BC
MIDWWRRQSQATRFEWYARGSFYTLVASSPLLLGGLVQREVAPGHRFVFIALLVLHTAVCLVLVHHGIGAYQGSRPRPTGLILVGGGLTAAGLVAAYLAYPEPTPGHADGPAAGLLLVFSVTYVSALAAAARPRTSIAVAVAFCGVGVLFDRTGEGVIALGALLIGVVLAYRVSLWMLGVVRELDRARHVQAGLAVAEERLRFARDMHDVVGRTLSVVALKAELAAQLARRGRAEAVDEMLEVRRIAQDSLTEMRAVVLGYRAADLDVELAGARALLASAGIECRVIGDSSGLPASLQGALGWVVREGTTNMLRHSEARTCTVTIDASPAAVTVTMCNDGVPSGAPPRFGSGLIGLKERIADLGGTVTAERLTPDRFQLSVHLPAAPVLGDGAVPA